MVSSALGNEKTDILIEMEVSKAKAEELDDLRYELKLYRRKEFELIKEVVNKL